MHGVIYFKTEASLATFLAAYAETGCTAEFVVEWINNAKGWELRFTGAI